MAVKKVLVFVFYWGDGRAWDCHCREHAVDVGISKHSKFSALKSVKLKLQYSQLLVC